jgi:hypothetical protein
MVKIYVGAELKLWVLPERLLCDRIEYFKSAIQSGFGEGKDKLLALPEVDPTAFTYILDMIFGEQHDNATKDFSSSYDAQQLMWCKVYSLADKLGCGNLVTSRNPSKS